MFFLLTNPFALKCRTIFKDELICFYYVSFKHMKRELKAEIGLKVVFVNMVTRVFDAPPFLRLQEVSSWQELREMKASFKRTWVGEAGFGVFVWDCVV